MTPKDFIEKREKEFGEFIASLPSRVGETPKELVLGFHRQSLEQLLDMVKEKCEEMVRKEYYALPDLLYWLSSGEK